MRRLLADGRFRIAAAVVALAVIAAAGALTDPRRTATEAAAPTEKVVVGRAAIGCPMLASATGTSTVVDAVSPVLPDGTPVAGGKQMPLEVRKLGGSGSPLADATQRGRTVSAKQGAYPNPLGIRLTGPLAAGTTATATATASTGVNRGMASTVCSTPSAEFWFAGASSASGRRDALVLTNLDAANASVDVTFFSPSGELEDAGGRGLVVRGRSQTEVFLSNVAKGQRELGLRVVSTGGRVSAALRDNVSAGTTPAGVDWLQPAADPAKELIVPGIAPGPGSRTLTVANPGDLQTTVNVTVLGARGRYRPAGRDRIQVPAGGIKSVRLESIVKNEPAAVQLSADQPVFAAMRIADARNADFAALGSTHPLTGPGYVVVPAHTEPATVLVSAPAERATADVVLRTASGETALSKTVAVATGSTAVVTLPATKGPTYLTVTPGAEAQVTAAVTLTPPTGDKQPTVRRVAAWPVRTSLVFRAQQGSRPDVRAALR